MIIMGKQVASQVYVRLKSNRQLSLGILIAGSDSVTDSFVRAKERAAAQLNVIVERETVPGAATTDDALAALARLAEKTDGVIVQLPLPLNMDTERVLAAIPPEKDVDGISREPRVLPPVAGALREILRVANVHVPGKRAVVVGSGRLVGAPCAKLLASLGADVTVLNKGDSLDALQHADIIVSGAGQPGMITPSHIKEGVVLVDAGTSESSGKVVGDADPTCADKASLFTPVPGGVGPIAVAMIFENLYTLVAQS